MYSFWCVLLLSIPSSVFATLATILVALIVAGKILVVAGGSTFGGTSPPPKVAIAASCNTRFVVFLADILAGLDAIILATQVKIAVGLLAGIAISALIVAIVLVWAKATFQAARSGSWVTIGTVGTLWVCDNDWLGRSSAKGIQKKASLVLLSVIFAYLCVLPENTMHIDGCVDTALLFAAKDCLALRRNCWLLAVERC